MDLLKEDIGWAKGLLWMDWGACIDRRNFTKFIIRKVLSEICFEWGQLRTFAVGRDWTLTRESAQHFPASGQRLFYWTSFSRVSLDDKHFCESCSNCQSERVGHSALPMSWKNTLLPKPVAQNHALHILLGFARLEIFEDRRRIPYDRSLQFCDIRQE